MKTTSAELAARLEQAQAHQNRAFIDALSALRPESGASTLAVKGGWSNFAGTGSPLSQAQALGLGGPLTAADLTAIEDHLAPQGGPIQVEITPFADPSLRNLVAQRSYRIHEFQQVFVTTLTAEPAASSAAVDVRPIDPGEADLWSEVVVKGFLEQESLEPGATDLLQPTPQTRGTRCFLAWIGDQPVGGGSLGVSDGVATLSGTSVRIPYRGRGVQRELILARLKWARERGCELASSSTLAATASQHNLERCGFAVAYPKLVMVRSMPSAAIEIK